MRLRWCPFRLPLPLPLVTAGGSLAEKRGWLLRLEDDSSSGPAPIGWGEAAPLEPDPGCQARALQRLAEAIEALGPELDRERLEARLPFLPAPLAFALGAALAESDGLVGGAVGWLPAPASAVLLPAGEGAVAALELALQAVEAWSQGPGPSPRQRGGTDPPFTCKWKVAAAGDAAEQRLLEVLLQRLPAGARLRLDANGGWDRATASSWAARLAVDGRLEWLEQPLDPADHEGLAALAAGPPPVPVALDESLRLDPALRQLWSGWQVRRPCQEGDPRPLLAQLRAGAPRLMLSTGFETGIGRRWLDHLAALQLLGPTPTAPGLAPGWSPAGALCAGEPEQVWQTAASAAGREPDTSVQGWLITSRGPLDSPELGQPPHLPR